MQHETSVYFSGSTFTNYAALRLRRTALTLGKTKMNKLLRELLDKVESVADFSGIDLRDVNDTNSFGDNALHCVCVWGDLDSAKLLVENGINIEQKGEGGFTPLKVASDFGKKDIVNYLISKGADIKALDAEFQFDREADNRHMKMLKDGIEKLEQKIDQNCGGGNA